MFLSISTKGEINFSLTVVKPKDTTNSFMFHQKNPQVYNQNRKLLNILSTRQIRFVQHAISNKKKF